MMDAIEKMMINLPPVENKNAGVACIVGFLAGGIGLAIYFKSIIDLVLPVAITVFLFFVIGDIGAFAGALLTAVYGYYRVTLSAAGAERRCSHEPA